MVDKFYKKYSPNPRLERKDYEFLCGEWDFAFADNDENAPVFDRKINVPYTYESEASGIGDTSCHNCIWYRRTFSVKRHDGAVLLHFEGVDYHSYVYINGALAKEHTGGFTAFYVDITEYVRDGENTVEVKVLDSLDKSQLRGKQRAETESYDCWYVQTTGIWKPVWIEYAGKTYLENVSFKAKNDGRVEAVFELSRPAKLDFTVFDGNDGIVYRSCVSCLERRHCVEFGIGEPKLWSVDMPALYPVKITIDDCDEVGSYFGFCEVEAKEDGLYINGKRTYQQMILYQGYWADTLLSAPDDVSLEKDIDTIKAMGFNGVRVHQKIENEVFYYLCDKKGLYVWGEIPSAYDFTDRMKEEFSRDSEIIFNELKNHVCVVSWLLFNETWGVAQINDSIEQQTYVESIAEKIRKADSRPLITNDGWHHLDSDILSLHEYEQDADVFAKEYADKNYVVTEKTINTNKFGKAFAKGYRYSHQPVFISEYGGIAIQGDDGWGYGDYASDGKSFEERLRKLVKTVLSLPYVSGACYTQFNDTMQEVNGLLDAERTAKLPIEVYDAIFSVKK